MENKICIVLHPLVRSLIYNLEPNMKRLPHPVIDKILEWSRPFKMSSIEGVRSELTKEIISGELILCPLLMDQMVALSPQKILRKVIDAAKLAETHKAKIIGLVAYTAFVGSRGLKVAERINTPLTNGLNLTAAVIPEAILKAIDALKLKKGNLKAFIFGVNPMVFISICRLQKYFSEFYVWHHKNDKVKELQASLPENIREKIKILTSNQDAVLSCSDVVINCTSGLPVGFDEKYLKPGAIVCDVSYPRKININREDILLIDGAVVVPPGNPDFNINFGLPKGLCFPCMAEPMVLAFEKKYDSYSLGGDISYAKAETIFNLALKHGFKVGPITSYEEVITEQKINQVKSLM